MEFPGCIAAGDTAEETLARLEGIAASWLQSMIARGQQIPEPLEAVNYSGKLVLRLSKSLHQKAAVAAHMDGVSLNSFIANCVAERVGERSRQAFTPTRTVNFSIHVVAGPGAASTQIPFENASSLKQVATSANRQLLGFPFWQKEAVNA